MDSNSTHDRIRWVKTSRPDANRKLNECWWPALLYNNLDEVLNNATTDTAILAQILVVCNSSNHGGAIAYLLGKEPPVSERIILLPDPVPDNSGETKLDFYKKFCLHRNMSDILLENAVQDALTRLQPKKVSNAPVKVPDIPKTKVAGITNSSKMKTPDKNQLQTDETCSVRIVTPISMVKEKSTHGTDEGSRYDTVKRRSSDRTAKVKENAKKRSLAVKPGWSEKPGKIMKSVTKPGKMMKPIPKPENMIKAITTKKGNTTLFWHGWKDGWKDYPPKRDYKNQGPGRPPRSDFDEIIEYDPDKSCWKKIKEGDRPEKKMEAIRTKIGNTALFWHGRKDGWKDYLPKRDGKIGPGRPPRSDIVGEIIEHDLDNSCWKKTKGVLFWHKPPQGGWKMSPPTIV